MKVGVFDSGVGGLTVLKKLVEKYPNNDYIYFGDTMNIPYGEKNIEELYNLSSKIVEFFIKKEVDLIVIACGTISSNCYTKLKSNYNVKIIDIISPTIKYIKENNFKDVGVLATTRTINSHIFKNSLNIPVYEEACSEFVDLIEDNKYELIDVEKHLKNIKSDNIILGCTHYPLIKNKINRNCIDMADNIILNEDKGSESINLYFSKLNNKVLDNINRIINKEVNIYEKKL